MQRMQRIDFIASRMKTSAEWLHHIWKEAWKLDRPCAFDEQAISIQGKSEHKTQCGKCKQIGDGIQADVISGDGYIWDVYF